MCHVLWVQKIWNQVRWVRAGHTSNTSGPKSSGQRLPSPVLRLRHVRQTAQHRRRVLPHGRQEVSVQTGL